MQTNLSPRHTVICYSSSCNWSTSFFPQRMKTGTQLNCNCPTTVAQLSRNCSPTVPQLFHNFRQPFRNRSATVPQPFRNRSPIVPQLFHICPIFFLLAPVKWPLIRENPSNKYSFHRSKSSKTRLNLSYAYSVNLKLNVTFTAAKVVKTVLYNALSFCEQWTTCIPRRFQFNFFLQICSVRSWNTLVQLLLYFEGISVVVWRDL